MPENTKQTISRHYDLKEVVVVGICAKGTVVGMDVGTVVGIAVTLITKLESDTKQTEAIRLIIKNSGMNTDATVTQIDSKIGMCLHGCQTSGSSQLIALTAKCTRGSKVSGEEQMGDGCFNRNLISLLAVVPAPRKNIVGPSIHSSSRVLKKVLE